MLEILSVLTIFNLNDHRQLLTESPRTINFAEIEIQQTLKKNLEANQEKRDMLILHQMGYLAPFASLYFLKDTRLIPKDFLVIFTTFLLLFKKEVARSNQHPV